MSEQMESVEVKNDNTPLLPEAGGVAWVDLFGLKSDDQGVKHLVKISLTQRSSSSAEALEGLLATMRLAGEKYKLAPYQISTTPAPAPVAVKPAPATAKPAPAPAVTTVDGDIVMRVVKIDVLPQPGGKTKVSFYGDTFTKPVDKFPTISSTRAPDQHAAVFSALGEEYNDPDIFEEAVSWTLTCGLIYRLSEKLDSKGNPFKDLVRLTA
jgi:hypothetical protein